MNFIEIATELSRLAEERKCSELEIVRRGLNAYRTWTKLSKAEREYLWASLEAGERSPVLNLMDQARQGYVPNEYRCPQCNFRSGQTDACVVDGSKMERVTWKDACLTATRIASKARERALALENSWPADHAMPVGSLDDLSIEDKIDQLREKGLYDIVFRNAGVGLMFFEPPKGVSIEPFRLVEQDIGDGQTVQMPVADDSWKKYLTVETYYDSLDEAINAEFQKRQS